MLSSWVPFEVPTTAAIPQDISAHCWQVMAIARTIRDEYEGQRDLSGIGGVETGTDAAEFLLLGANSVQVSWEELTIQASCCSSCWLATPQGLALSCHLWLFMEVRLLCSGARTLAIP